MNYFVCTKCDIKRIRRYTKEDLFRYCKYCDILLEVGLNWSPTQEKKCHYVCNLCTNEKKRRDTVANIMITLTNSVKKNNLICNVDYNYIKSIMTDKCSIFGTPITRNSGRPKDDSISLDKIIPELGYTKGNVQIISYKANRIKNNASLEELIILGEWAKQQLKNKNLFVIRRPLKGNIVFTNNRIIIREKA